ncbi:kelch-like protein 3 [Biomphalaria glabrata]|uniref:Kelch-like protein 3 n=1 Tax=Biomphalaria glabrata TaxID=6526 RepID=A0A9U8EN20_BIOGL|nr:kelch-like protein 3 [Biomphalaria glabrata]
MAVSDQLAKAVVKGIQDQMDRCPFHDVIIVVDGVEFKGHRFLLSACSDFFRAMFQSGMKEDLERRVEVKSISPSVFKLLIDSVYYARSVLTAENVSSVWHAASQLQIHYLLEACEIFQSKRLSRESCVDIHIDAKLLSSKKLLDLSWDVIVKEFDHLRKMDDILYLDFEDMKSLVSDDNLTVPSEDVVIETILRWVSYKPAKYSDEYNKDGKDLAVSHSEHENTTLSIEKSTISKGSRGTKTGKSEDVVEEKKESVLGQSSVLFNRKETTVSADRDRKDFLAELLAASKLMLVSGACLQNLLEIKLVLEDSKAFALVRESLRYHLQPGRRHNYCPLYGKFRNTSLVQNVVYTISGLYPMKFSCRTPDGKWYTLPAQQAMKCRAVTYENDIYWTTATGTHQLASKFDLNTIAWRNIASMGVPRQDHALVCLDNYIYAIGGVNCASIERFDVAAEQKVPDTGKWESYGNLVQPMTNLTATTCNNLIVIFGSESDNSPTTVVQIFNPQTLSANIYMDNMSGSAKNLASFKHGEDTFVLQENGALWTVSIDCNNILDIRFYSMIWGDPFKLMGAVVTNQELLVFGESVDPQMPREWDVATFQHFKRVKIIERQGYCFLNTVIQKRFLVTFES